VFNAAAVPEGSSEDLNTRARIRDAAMRLFGEGGFDVGVRAIAAAAGVSPGLVNHHFGSKDGLRKACDDHLREFIRQAKMQYLQAPSAKGLLQSLAEIEDFAPYLAYLMRSLRAGGPLTVELFDHMVDDMQLYLTTGIANGTLRAPKDLKTTARYLALQNGGGVLLFLELYAQRQQGRVDYRKALREYAEAVMLPAVELYTQGLLTDSMMLDTLLANPTPHTSPPSRKEN
jgi:AcrR family transcriptional regulator